MNWLEREVPNLELCKKLREVGYPQEEAGWYWVKKGNFWELTLWDGEKVVLVEDCIKAPTCREMAEWVDKSLFAAEFVYYPLQINPNEFARDVIWLKQHDYIDFKDGASFIIGFTVERREDDV